MADRRDRGPPGERVPGSAEHGRSDECRHRDPVGDQEHAVPFRVKPVGWLNVPEYVPWNPKDWEPPAGI